MLRLKELREEKGLTQNEIATAIETSQTNIARWEKGKNEPSYIYLVKLSDFFNCSLDYLAGVESEDFQPSKKAKFVPHAANDAAMPGTLSDDEKELLKVFRGLSATGKKTLIGSAHNIEKYDPQAAAKKKA